MGTLPQTPQKLTGMTNKKSNNDKVLFLTFSFPQCEKYKSCMTVPMLGGVQCCTAAKTCLKLQQKTEVKRNKTKQKLLAVKPLLPMSGVPATYAI